MPCNAKHCNEKLKGFYMCFYTALVSLKCSTSKGFSGLLFKVNDIFL